LPFIASFPFYSPQGELLVALPLFKSLMVVIGSMVGIGLLLLGFRTVRPGLMTGLVIGLYWLALNWLLDIAVLVPMAGLDIGGYFADIGLRYLVLPMIAVGMGLVGQWARQGFIGADS
jgi:hypothetical protein